MFSPEFGELPIYDLEAFWRVVQIKLRHALRSRHALVREVTRMFGNRWKS